jgi:drug/metabolite transporter (DMT)-like permease
MLLGYVFLIALILGGSSVSPLCSLVKVEKVFLRNIWRYSACLVYAIPIAIIQSAFDTNFKVRNLIQWRIWLLLAASAVSISLWTGLLIQAAEYTVISHAILLNNCGGIFIILGSLLFR